jgi:hypothetical protein
LATLDRNTHSVLFEDDSMKITYANVHTWYKIIQEDPLQQFGKNARPKLQSTLKRLEACGITTKIEKVDKELLSWFAPLYDERLREKENPLQTDLEGKLLQSSHRYYALSLYEKGKPLGATLYRLGKYKLSIAYRTYVNTWKEAKLQASPSLLMEYEICKQALASGKHTILHGRDRNPYGVNSSIGLAAFKLASGCKVRKSEKFDIHEIDSKTIDSEMLILEYPGDAQKRITQAYLFLKEENKDKWDQLTKYPHLLSVETIFI